MVGTRAKIQEEILPEECVQSFTKLNEDNQPTILFMTSNIYFLLTYLRPHKSVKPNGKKVITKIYTNCHVLPFFAFLGKFKSH